MIITKLQGGLGNQMFQYALARKIALKHKTSVFLNNTYFNKKDARNFGLDVFVLEKHIASPNHLFLFGMDGAKSKINNYYKLLRKLISPIVIKEKQFNFDSEVLVKAKKYTSLMGYWQTEEYFIDIKDVLLKDFRIRTSLEGKNLKIADDIKSTNSISLHVRRGDYLTKPDAIKIHGTCDINYYNKAIEVVTTHINNPVFYVFSDEIEWVKKNLKTQLPIVYVDHNSNENAYEDLRLMSLCKHNIIANSSFSWWGAWLNTNDSKLVIAPSKWFATNEFNSSDIVPEKWIKL
jgi:hypothetical protein